MGEIAPFVLPAKVPVLFDLNRNGIPDYQEPAFAKLLFRVGLFAARMFAPQHTVFRRLMESANFELTRTGVL